MCTFVSAASKGAKMRHHSAWFHDPPPLFLTCLSIAGIGVDVWFEWKVVAGLPLSFASRVGSWMKEALSTDKERQALGKRSVYIFDPLQAVGQV
jgi:hypothetical protein